MDRAPFDRLEELAKQANIPIPQSLASNLFSRRKNIERQTQILKIFRWPDRPDMKEEFSSSPSGEIRVKEHIISEEPIRIILPEFNARQGNISELMEMRVQLAQWVFYNAFASVIVDSCCIADAVGALLMRGYLNPKQSPMSSGIEKTYEWAKDQPPTNTIAKRIERLLLAHAGPNAWSVCLREIRNDFVHKTAERLQFVDGRFKITFSTSDGGKSTQQQFVKCFGPNTDSNLSAFSSLLCGCIDKLVYDCTNGINFDWPKLS